MTRWYFTLEAMDPNDTSRQWEVGIHRKLYESRQMHGHERSLARIILVHEVLSGNVTYIYSGWSRPDKDDCHVYVGFPDRDHKSSTIDTPAPKGMAFLVFVLPDGTIDEWTWRPIDEQSGKPQGVKGELIWSRNQK